VLGEHKSPGNVSGRTPKACAKTKTAVSSALHSNPGQSENNVFKGPAAQQFRGKQLLAAPGGWDPSKGGRWPVFALPSPSKGPASPAKPGVGGRLTSAPNNRGAKAARAAIRELAKFANMSRDCRRILENQYGASARAVKKGDTIYNGRDGETGQLSGVATVAGYRLIVSRKPDRKGPGRFASFLLFFHRGGKKGGPGWGLQAIMPAAHGPQEEVPRGAGPEFRTWALAALLGRG